MQLGLGYAGLCGQRDAGGQMGLDLPEIFFLNQFCVRLCDKAALTGHCFYEALALELFIGTLGCDHADTQVLCERAHGRQRVPGLKLAGQDQRFDLSGDLVVDRLAGGIAND